jgi:hypothetical protein
MKNDYSRAQADMRAAYCGGAAGILASAIVWMCAAIVSAYVTPVKGVWTLLIGGAFIHPAAMLISKVLGGTGSHSKESPLASLAGASTVWLLLSLLLAFAISLQRIEWFFPAVLLIIGGRYTVFHSLYGLRIYWAFGIALAATGLVLAVLRMNPVISASIGAFIEAAFGIAVLILNRRTLVTAEKT